METIHRNKLKFDNARSQAKPKTIEPPECPRFGHGPPKTAESSGSFDRAIRFTAEQKWQKSTKTMVICIFFTARLLDWALIVWPNKGAEAFQK
jgi:hypothetical protein